MPQERDPNASFNVSYNEDDGRVYADIDLNLARLIALYLHRGGAGENPAAMAFAKHLFNHYDANHV